MRAMGFQVMLQRRSPRFNQLRAFLQDFLNRALAESGSDRQCCILASVLGQLRMQALLVFD